MVEVTESAKAAIDLLTKIEEYDHACDCDDCNSLRTHTLPFVVQAFATHRIEAAKAERDRLRELPDAVALQIYNIAGDEGIDLAPSQVRLIATALADALEGKPVCRHDRTSTATTGDGVEVIFCTECGKNIHIGQMPWQDGDALESKP